MTFEQIYYFSKIYEKGSINGAANACYISYQAMSKSLRNLEQELEMMLVIRNHSNISFTPEGLIFYEDCKKILEMREKWRNLSWRAKKNQEVKHLHIVAVPFFQKYIFPRLIPLLEEKGYYLEYTIVTLDLMDLLLENSADATKLIGLTCHMPPFPKNIVKLVENSHWEICHLFSDSFFAYFNRDYFSSLYGKNVEEIDAKDLWTMPYIENGSSMSHLTPYAALQNPEMARYKGYQHDVFELLETEPMYAFVQSRLKKDIEKKYPQIIGVKIKDAPPMNIDYYLVYSQMLAQQDYGAVEFIKEYFVSEAYDNTL